MEEDKKFTRKKRGGQQNREEEINVGEKQDGSPLSGIGLPRDI